MKPNLSVVTLGVSNFKRSLDFKGVLGWPTSKERDGIAFFDTSGTILALYDKNSLAEDANVSSKEIGFSGITPAHNARSEKQVDKIFNQIEPLISGLCALKAEIANSQGEVNEALPCF